jgi:hypothetical protein
MAWQVLRLFCYFEGKTKKCVLYRVFCDLVVFYIVIYHYVISKFKSGRRTKQRF